MGAAGGGSSGGRLRRGGGSLFFCGRSISHVHPSMQVLAALQFRHTHLCLQSGMRLEEKLGEIAEGGGAARGDAIGGKSLHDASDGAVNLFLGGNAAGEAGQVGSEFVVDNGT